MILPKITVITPTLNTGESIETALFSVANQSYQNIEHIIVDGGSKDKTLPIVRKFQKTYKNVRLLTEKDSGIYDAMNKGLDLCTGDWIIFLGADDSFYNEHVLTDLYEHGFFQEEQVVYGNVIIKGDAPWAKDNSIYDGPFILEKLFKINISHQSIFYPRSVIRQVGYYSTKYKITADWDYNLRCWAKYKFTYSDTIIAFFTTGGKSSEGDDSALHIDFPNNVIKYFNLDVNDRTLYLATSPFYYPVSRYWENEYIHNIQEFKAENEKLKQHIADQQTSHDETISSIQKQHEISDNAFRTEFNETILNLKAEQDHFLNSLRAEHDSTVQDIKFVHDQVVIKLKEEQDHLVTILRADHDQAIASLKDEHGNFVTNLRTENDLFVVELKSNHTESVNYLRRGHEDIIKSLQSEHEALRETFQQKETEFNQVIESNNQIIDHLNRALASNELLFKETVEKNNYEISKLNDEIAAKDQQIFSIFNSYTWQIGKILLTLPVFVLKKLRAGKNKP